MRFARLAVTGVTIMLAATTGVASPTTRPAAIPPLVAHRGASADAPENTLAAFKLGWAQGADAVEADYHLTRDGKVVTMHDKDARRTAGVPLKMAEATFEQVRALDVGEWKDVQFAGERPPTLTELLETVPAGKKAYLEIKCGPEIVREFVREVRASGVRPEQLVMITFNDPVIPAFKKEMPEVPAYLLFRFRQDKQGRWNETHANLIARAKQAGADGLDLAVDDSTREVVTPELVAAARAAGLTFHAYTIDDAATARRAIELGAESITTNRPGALRAELQKSK